MEIDVSDDVKIELNEDGSTFTLLEDYNFRIGVLIVTIPKGTVTDFASIPRPFWTLIGSPIGKYSKAALIHDYLYQTQMLEKRLCDWIFYKVMLYSGVNKIKAWVMYKAVDNFGHSSYNSNKKPPTNQG